MLLAPCFMSLKTNGTPYSLSNLDATTIDAVHRDWTRSYARRKQRGAKKVPELREGHVPLLALHIEPRVCTL